METLTQSAAETAEESIDGIDRPAGLIGNGFDRQVVVVTFLEDGFIFWAEPFQAPF